MAAVTVPRSRAAPRRRRWLVAGVVAWALLVVAVAFWSVRHDAPTVAEQRDIARSLPVLDRAAAAVLAAADAPDRVVELGPLLLTGCPVTPVRRGAEAARGVVVHVRPGAAGPALDAIASGLPRAYRAQVAHLPSGRVLRADAGGFVGLRAAAGTADTVLTVQITTGCRPLAAGVRPGPSSDAPAASVPPPLAAAVRALGGAAGAGTVRTVPCPGGGEARTTVVDGLRAPADLGAALRPVLAGATVVETDPSRYAYRSAAVSVVVTPARATATAVCSR
jgi:hypothetical protein